MNPRPNDGYLDDLLYVRHLGAPLRAALTPLNTDPDRPADGPDHEAALIAVMLLLRSPAPGTMTFTRAERQTAEALTGGGLFGRAAALRLEPRSAGGALHGGMGWPAKYQAVLIRDPGDDDE